jgi:hypothetical protein
VTVDDDTEIQASDLGQPMMIGLDWIAFNAERAIGRRPAAPAEVALSSKLAPGLLAAIPHHASTALRIPGILHL